MSSVAEQIRGAREAQKLTIQQIAETTKIRSDHIRALEEGNFNVFVAPVYIRGFVRSYATLLKLEVPKVMADLDAELGRTQKFCEPPPLTKQSRGLLDFVMLQFSRMDWRKMLVAFGGVALIGVVVGGWTLWRHRKSTDPLAGLPAGVYQSSDSGATLPLK